MLEPPRLTTLWASTACYRDNFTFTLTSVSPVFPLKVLVKYNRLSTIKWYIYMYVLKVLKDFSAHKVYIRGHHSGRYTKDAQCLMLSRLWYSSFLLEIYVSATAKR
jgi:hypothetical protein